MQQLDGLPVVIGSSMSGLLVSLSLSRAGIDHALIGGDEPPDVPRLGESLNECAGPELWRWFGPQYDRFFYTKNHISILNGDFATMLHIGNPNRRIEDLARFHQCDGRTPLAACVKGLLHVDRIGLDRAVYHDATSQPQCRFIRQRVSQMRYDGPSDAVAEIGLEGGDKISRPRYVFDASGPRGLVAEAAGVGRQTISERQLVVWTHYIRDEQNHMPRHWWLFGTNLLRLHKENDGFDGISWLIPLGNTLSVGVSVDEPATQRHDETAVMRMLAAAYQRRGVDYPALFPRQREIQQLKHQYYVRDRAHGANWLLVGGTFLQIWFPSSAGLWTTTAAAGMAAELIRDPSRRGPQYEAMMRRLLPFHGLLDELAHGRAFDSEMDAYWFWSRWLSRIPQRVSAYLRIANGELHTRRLRYRFLDWVSRQFVRFPSGALAYWGLLLIRARRVSDLPRQAEAFPGYFRTRRFRAKNYIVGLVRLGRSWLTWQWTKRRWDD